MSRSAAHSGCSTDLRLQLESPDGWVSRFILQYFHAWHRDVAANLFDVYQLGGRVPVALRLAGDLHAGDPLQPRAHFRVASDCIYQLGQIRSVGVVLAIF